MLQANLPKTFWGDCVLTAVHLINLLPVQQLQFKYPYELIYDKILDYNCLRVFGCLCQIADVLSPSDKFNPRGLKCVFLGYPFGKKGYRVMHLDTRKCYNSRDVVFVENVFPFHTIHTTDTTTLFPSEMMLSDSTINSNPIIVLSPDAGSTSSPMPVTLDTEHNTTTGSDNLIEHYAPIIRPTHTKILPSKFKDFTGLPELVSKTVRASSSNVCTHPLSKYISYHMFRAPHMAFLDNISKALVPYTYARAVIHKHWAEAMSVEIAALESNKTWEIVPRPVNKNVVDCKWLFKIKYTPDGNIDKYKACLVAKGFTQTIGVDYFETYAPIAKMTTVRVVLALAANFNQYIHQMDVNNAFLHGVLTEEIYMKLPPGFQQLSSAKFTFPSDVELVCKLIKSIYGLKHAPRVWNDKLAKSLVQFGFTQVACDHSLFTLKKLSGFVVVIVYVDDILITGNSQELIAQVKDFLHSQYKIKDLGPMKYFLGLELARNSEGNFLNQHKYVLDILADTGLASVKPSAVPIEQNHKLIDN